MKVEKVQGEFIYCGARVVVYSTYITLAGQKIFKHLLHTPLRMAVEIEQRHLQESKQAQG